MRVTCLFLVGCAAATPVPASLPAPEATAPLADETHFISLKQLTFGGENAEAYWSHSGQELIMQAHGEERSCDRIYRMGLTGQRTAVSNGQGATTCSYFLPGDDEVIFASTQLGGAECPPKPDHSQGYVWPLYPSYDIFKSKPDGSNMVRLTDAPGYDAEGTVCAKDGSIVFTSVRDGDLELYRMDRDGQNVKRLTHTPGYDGGAFFNADCTKLVWRASRPKAGPEMDDYKRLLTQNMVRPSKLELYVGNADGSEATQVTYLDAASFGPYFHPNGKRIVFSSNYGDPKGREFDIFSINVDGTGLERITSAKGFDGFPIFSPDGRSFAFSSNRATAPGRGDTNVFVAEWNDSASTVIERAEDRMARDVAWLSDPARGGRGTGDKELEASAAYIEARFKKLGWDTERQTFEVTTKIEAKAPPVVTVNGKPLKGPIALAISASGKVKGKLVFAGYGLDYPKDVKGAVVLVRRFVPEGVDARQGDLRKKAWLAREKGAKALLVVDLPEGQELPPEAGAPASTPESYADSGLPVLLIKREDGAALIKKGGMVDIDVQLEATKTPVSNIVARLAGPGDAVLIGAHYDHLGMGGRNSLAPDQHAPHVGADDNASGTAALLEIAQILAMQKNAHETILVAFTAEELGVLGSTHFVRQLGNKKIAAMLNMDMIGRLRGNTVQVLGSETSKEWPELLNAVCTQNKLACAYSGGGYGPSDQTPFYAAGIAVLHFFTGAHADYHKPSDTADKINYAGAAKIATVVADLSRAITKPMGFVSGGAAVSMGGDRRSFNASLGTVPDYAGPSNGKKGVLLSGVRPGSAAEKAGLKRGDVLTQLGTHTIGSVEDLMFALNASKPGETVKATVDREGVSTVLPVTFEERARR